MRLEKIHNITSLVGQVIMGFKVYRGIGNNKYIAVEPEVFFDMTLRELAIILETESYFMVSVGNPNVLNKLYVESPVIVNS